MATNTYVALDKVTVGSAVASVTLNMGSSITQTYTDLIMVINAANTSGNQDVTFRLNGDSGANYSRTYLRGNGSTATSTRATGATSGYLTGTTGTSTTAGEYNSITHFMNYSNATTYKTIITRSNLASNGTEAVVNLWSATPQAITSIVVTSTTGTFTTGSTFSLYGIRAEGTSPAPKATGGAIYSDSTYYYHVFGTTGTFTPLSSLTADVLVVAGGGGGGQDSGGGGGAGGLLSFASQALSATGYSITVGAGGAGSVSYGGSSNGSNSQFAALTACVGGGKGASIGGSYLGGTGGSGGGGAGGGPGGGSSAGSGTSGQGYAGGVGYVSGGSYPGGGGGGAGGVGQSYPNTSTSGAGGIGATSTLITAIVSATGVGQLVSGTGYIAGGGGGTGGTAGVGGYGGGGNGGGAGNGVAFTGSGGGGGTSGATTGVGGSGGSGVVIVRYAK